VLPDGPVSRAWNKPLDIVRLLVAVTNWSGVGASRVPLVITVERHTGGATVFVSEARRAAGAIRTATVPGAARERRHFPVC